jgi:hypothetical protein
MSWALLWVRIPIREGFGNYIQWPMAEAPPSVCSVYRTRGQYATGQQRARNSLKAAHRQRLQ